MPDRFVQATIITFTFALLFLTSVVICPAHAMVVLSILSVLTLTLLELGYAPLMSNAHFHYAGTLRDTEATAFRRWRDHAITNRFTAC